MSDEQLRAVDKLKVVELKAELSQLGLSTAGLKADLAQRLKNHIIAQLENEPSDASDETVENSPKSPGEPDQPDSLPDIGDEERVPNQELITDELSADPALPEAMSVDVEESLTQTQADCTQDHSLEAEPVTLSSEESEGRNQIGESESQQETEPSDASEETVENSPKSTSVVDSRENFAEVPDEVTPPRETFAVELQNSPPSPEAIQVEENTAPSKVEAQRREVLHEKEVNAPVKKSNETKNQKKKRRKKTRKLMKNLNKDAGSDGESARDSEHVTDVEIEYVPDQVEKDISWFQYSKVFEKFQFEDPLAAEGTEVKEEAFPVADRLLERKKPADLSEDEDDEEKKDDGSTPKLSKKKLKQLTRMSVAELKIKVHHPELVEMHDVTTKDPVFLLTLKATRNSVPVPRHWCFKRKYLQGKRGIEKPPFDLPGFIKRTGICEMRAALQEKEEAKTLKSKQREKIRPKMGKIDIDYQKLHDAFFKWQTKPKLAMHGDLYYEGKEFETRLKEKKPGDLSDDLRTALGMPTGPNAAKCPPPWLIAMQRYGPPPSYPNLKIPGLNAPIPEGCSFGYHAGGWGKPPVDETGKPLYGDVFGLTAQESGVSQVEQDIDKAYLFGTMEEEESEEESEEEEEEESETEELDETGLVTPAEGLATPSGLQSSVSQAAEISDSIELRKRKIEAEMEMGDQLPQLYTVLHEKKTDRIGHAMMGSVHTYDVPGQPPTNKKGVELALDPSELEMDPGAMAARYEQTVREQQSQLAKEDFSDMVAEHAAKQKNKRKAREEAGAGGKKKYKEFKF